MRKKSFTFRPSSTGHLRMMRIKNFKMGKTISHMWTFRWSYRKLTKTHFMFVSVKELLMILRSWADICVGEKTKWTQTPLCVSGKSFHEEVDFDEYSRHKKSFIHQMTEILLKLKFKRRTEIFSNKCLSLLCGRRSFSIEKTILTQTQGK